MYQIIVTGLMRAGWSLDDIKLIPMTKTMESSMNDDRNDDKDDDKGGGMYDKNGEININDGHNKTINDGGKESFNNKYIRENERIKDRDTLDDNSNKKVENDFSKNFQHELWFEIKNGLFTNSCGHRNVVEFSGSGDDNFCK